MKSAAIAMLAGLLFGAGLAISGMGNPARVQAFLDIFGNWDPTLAFVMGGALGPMAIAWVWQSRLTRPFAAASFELPATTEMDRRLVVGAILFGAGWGVGGLCPGPAIAVLSITPIQAGVFVTAMLAGMAAHLAATRKA